jgi:hypothetical protein
MMDKKKTRNIEDKKISNREKLYFKIAGVFALVLLVKFLLFHKYSFLANFLPMSLVFFEISLFGRIILTIIIIFSLFFILKSFSIMADRKKFYNLKIFLKVFFVLVLIISLLSLIYTESLKILGFIISILYIVLGLWIFKLRDESKLLITWISLLYIAPVVMDILIISLGWLSRQLFSQTSFPFGLAFFGILFLIGILSIIIIGGYVCMFILFFRLANGIKKNGE